MLYDTYGKANRGAWTDGQIEQYLPLVKRIAGRLAISLPPYVDEGDLIGHGVFGLLDALERFDPSRGVKFETYASVRIRGAIIDGLRLMDWVPHSARQRVKQVQDAFAQLESDLGRSPTLEEVAPTLNMTNQEVEDVLVQAKVLVLSSIDELIQGDEGDTAGSIVQTIEDPTAHTAFTGIEEAELQKILEEAVTKLPEKEKLVVALYYQEELTLKEIAAILKLSESRICQLHSQAILRLRGRLSRQKKILFGVG